MGSKRPDQIRKDLLATDQKSRTNDEHIHEEDKAALKAEREAPEMPGAPKRDENPALKALRDSRIPRDSDGA
jgi:hypothetical protein